MVLEWRGGHAVSSRIDPCVVEAKCRSAGIVSSMSTHRADLSHSDYDVGNDRNCLSRRSVHAGMTTFAGRLSVPRSITLGVHHLPHRYSVSRSALPSSKIHSPPTDRYVGLVLVAHGICHVIGGYVFGWLAKHIGRLGCFIVGALLNYVMLAVMYFWQPNVAQTFVLFVIASVWGVADSIWQSQVVGKRCVCSSSARLTGALLQPRTRFCTRRAIRPPCRSIACGNLSAR